MKKIFIVGVFLLFLVASYFTASNLFDQRSESQIELDKNFKAISDELDEYGGGMIVSYDVETGEITGKRRVGEPRQEGVLSITEKEWEESNGDFPKGTLVVPEGLTPSQAIEYGGNS